MKEQIKLCSLNNAVAGKGITQASTLFNIGIIDIKYLISGGNVN